MATGKQKVIIDVDTGVDDAQAIMMALAACERLDILGITCVTGNTGVDQACYNTLRVLQTCNRLEVPVYKGACVPLVSKSEFGVNHHGNDGLGNTPHDDPPDVSLIQSEHAVTALIRLVNENKGEVMLIALAPLTNIALALRMDPDFGGKLKHTVIMGGNIEGKGNVTAASEFNFDFDPEAAFIVLRDLRSSTQILCWEPCLYNGIPWEWYDNLMLKQDTAVQRFHSRINEVPTRRKKEVLKCTAYYSCDPAAMSVAIDPHCVLTSEKVYCTVELQGQVTRGQMVVDWRGKFGKEPNVEIVTKVDIEKVKKLYVAMLEQ